MVVRLPQAVLAHLASIAGMFNLAAEVPSSKGHQYTLGTAERLDDPAYLKGVLDRLPIGHVGTIADVAGR